MASTVEFPFSDDEALPTIPIILSYADSSVSANALLDTGSTAINDRTKKISDRN